MEIVIITYRTGIIVTTLNTPEQRDQLNYWMQLKEGYVPQPGNVVPMASMEEINSCEYGTCLMGVVDNIYWIQKDT
jgi:hypothetical protein